MKQILRRYIQTTDKWLWLLCGVVTAMGILLQYGTLRSGYQQLLDISNRNVLVQCAAFGIGLVSALVISGFDYQFLRKSWVVHVPLCYVLVLLTFLIGTGAAARPDDKRWLVLPVVDVWFQPAEVLKISFILVFAHHLIRCGEELNRLPNILGLCVHAGIPIVLVQLQGDSGTALLIATIAVTMLFVAGISWKYIVGAAAGFAAVSPLLWRYVVSDFQKQRILILLHQEEADLLGQYYQQYQSKLAMANGGMTGIGLLDVDHIYVPEMHTDFIFTFLCESLGFMGALGVIALMVAMSMKILYNSSLAVDRYGSLVCIGVFSMILFQFAVNVGMCISVLPVIGNTFPFLSYGGSSLITNFAGIGLVQSVYANRKRGMFSG